MDVNSAMSMYQFVKESLSSLKEDATLYYFKGKRITKARFFRDVNRVAGALSELGINKGDVVAVNLPNYLNAIVVFYAVNQLGAIANMIHPLIPFEAVSNILSATKSKLFVTSDFFLKQNREMFSTLSIKVVLCKASDYLPILSGVIYNLSQKIVNTDLVIPYRKLLSHKPISTTAFYDKNDSAVYLHSGGTTGDPKTVMLSCYAFNELAQDLYEVIGGSAPEDNASLMVLPLFHGFGLGVCMHTVLSYGMKTVLIPRFNAREVAKEVKRRRVTFCAGVPLMYDKLNRLCEKDFAKLKTLRFMFCGGDKLTEELKKSFDNHLKAVGDNYEILEGYGLTETVNVCTVNKQGYCVNSCVGYPLRNIEINILSEDGRALPVGEKGEIAVRSETIMLGYLGGSKVESIIDRDGAKWLLTGDVGYLDKEGRLYFCDRIKRTFKVNGVNVYPSEIEQVLSGIDIVKECFVSKFVGAGKEGVKAYVSLRKDVLEERDAKKKILSVCAEKLIKYAVPREIIFMERLPRTPVGKIDSAKLS